MQGQMQEPFSKRTHYHNARGKLLKTDHYRLHVREGVQYFERPINSGNLWFENGEAAGRVEYVNAPGAKFASKRIDPEAPHKIYRAPLVGAEKLSFENQELVEAKENLQDENDALRAELQAIKAEMAAKQTSPKPARDAAPEKTESEKHPPQINRVASPQRNAQEKE